MDKRERKTPDDPGELFAPNGAQILGTLERVAGRANIVTDSFRLEDGDRLEFDYEGETKMWWNEQHTVTRAGQRVFIDEYGDEWTEDQLVAALTGREVPPDREDDSAVMLAALESTLPALILLGNYIGNEWKGGGGIEAFDRCAIIAKVRAAISAAKGAQ